METTKETRIYFKPSEINGKCRNLESNGFKEYLNVFEKYTVFGDKNLNHIIYTNTKAGSFYEGVVCDIYYNHKTAFELYSKQF